MRPEIQFLSVKRMLGYGTTEMRCVQPARFLRDSGWHCTAAAIHETTPRATRLLVLHRVPADALTRRAVAIARTEGVPVVYDVDDLIFDPDGEAHLQGFISANAPPRDLTRSFREAMELCDAVSASTAFLKARIDAFHPNCVVMPNGISRSLMERGAAPRPRIGDGVTLAYYSGSAHHDADFAIIQPALSALLEAESRARLLIVGKLAFDEGFRRFGTRFEYRPFLPYVDFIDSLADADINLVPLVTESPFAQARSELKYIEAGAFGVPTVASPTQTYAAAIHHGETGLLCRDGDWFETLRALLRDEDRRRAMGSAARGDTLRRYGPDVMAQRWDRTVRDLARTAHPSLARRLAATPVRARQAAALSLRRGKTLFWGRQ